MMWEGEPIYFSLKHVKSNDARSVTAFKECQQRYYLKFQKKLYLNLHSRSGQNNMVTVLKPKVDAQSNIEYYFSFKLERYFYCS